MTNRDTSPSTAAPAWDLQVTVRCGGPLPVLQIDGELDHGCAPLVTAMVDHVEAAHGRPLLVDLTGVSYADSHGLAPLLRDGVEIRRTSAQVRRLLHLLGLATAEGASLPAPAPAPSRRRDRCPRAHAHRRRPALRPSPRR